MISPSQAAVAESTGPVGVSVVPQLSSTVGGVGKTIFAYNQQLLLSVVLQGMVHILLLRYEHSLVSCLRNLYKSRCK